MKKFLKNHINFIEEKLTSGDADWPELLAYHRAQIGFLQHERLIHLLVALFFGQMFFLTILVGIFFGQIYWGILAVILLVVLIFYIWHYFCLENGAQKLYKLDAEITQKID